MTRSRRTHRRLLLSENLETRQLLSASPSGSRPTVDMVEVQTISREEQPLCLALAERSSVMSAVVADDHGDDSATATRLNANQVIQGEIEQEWDRDWFQFAAHRGFQYDIQTTLGTLYDSVLRLVDTDGQTVLESDDDSGVGLASRIQWTATREGTFFVVVGGYSNETGTYDLQLTETPTYALGDTNRDGRVDAADIDHLYLAIATHDTDADYDLNGDRQVNRDDVTYLVEDVLRTSFGDANLDGVFNSEDFLQAFQAGSYDRTGSQIVSWSEGDWNGDEVFDSQDFALAFQSGRYVPWSDDNWEQNDTLATAADLGLVEETLQIDDLQLLDRQDWYRFRTDRPGTAASHVTIEFSHGQGDLDLRLYDATGRLVGESATYSDLERISLNHRPAGEFFLQVYGYDRAINPDYSLQIDPGQGVKADLGSTLWLNFDGASIRHEDLLRWSTDWEISVNGLDPERDGVQIAPFLQGSSRWGQREAVIDRLIGYVQQDLTPYGIQVQRTRSLAVEDQGETTIFVGDSPLVHRAGDIDFGNDNRTDIAFVSDEWWGSVDDTALALADVVLHEAGHTFGLFHVNTVVGGVALPESMGLRYSEPDQARWLQDTSFMDRTFVEYWNHGGGRGSQNAHQTMLQNFGFANTVSPAELVRYEITPDGVFSLTTSAGADTVIAQAAAGGGLELVVNGQAFQLGADIRQVQVHTEGDARDRVVLANDLALELVLNQGTWGDLADAGKSVAGMTPSVAAHEVRRDETRVPSAGAVDMVLLSEPDGLV